jgi:3'-phosphoadenosine 5'-phosphosulfate sulfotransferase (PAPS reductase)/FAD synthetase
MALTHSDYSLSQLDVLEAESIHIIREVAAEFGRPVLLFSGGKDSIVMLALAERAFSPAKIPFPVMHVDTGHNFPEVMDFRDRRVAETGVRLVVASVQESIDGGRVTEETGRWASRNRLQTVTLLDAISDHRFDAVFRRRRPGRGEGAGEGASLLFPGRIRPVGPQEPASRAVEYLQHQDQDGRAHPGVPAVQLD